MKAMILAAGRGERMRPLTDKVPKPLLEVAGKPLIFWHLEKLAAMGIQEVVINTAWLADKLVQAIQGGEAFGLKVHWSHEPAGGLETAGGIIQALPWLGEAPFLLVNGDIWFEYDFSQLPRQPQGLGHLILVDNPEHHPQGDFVFQPNTHPAQRLNQAQPICLREDSLALSKTFLAENSKTYSGLAVLSPNLFAHETLRRLPLKPLFKRAADAGALFGECSQKAWTDVGTPTRLQALNQSLAIKDVKSVG